MREATIFSFLCPSLFLSFIPWFLKVKETKQNKNVLPSGCSFTNSLMFQSIPAVNHNQTTKVGHNSKGKNIYDNLWHVLDDLVKSWFFVSFSKIFCVHFPHFSAFSLTLNFNGQNVIFLCCSQWLYSVSWVTLANKSLNRKPGKYFFKRENRNISVRKRSANQSRGSQLCPKAPSCAAANSQKGHSMF